MMGETKRMWKVTIFHSKIMEWNLKGMRSKGCPKIDGKMRC
jgi:hypothetical protein